MWLMQQLPVLSSYREVSLMVLDVYLILIIRMKSTQSIQHLVNILNHFHLYRFYSDDSSFIHGGIDKPGDVSKPVYGQSDINSKIISLNFKDCHAKIRQVDSLETVGKGVVIQVTGELSNNQEPMRRFFQTFVLAPRSPTNYYVRNDIFRYQDEVFNDDEEYSETEKVDTDLEQNEQPLVTEKIIETPQENQAKLSYPAINMNGTNHKSSEDEKPIEENVEMEETNKIVSTEEEEWNSPVEFEEIPVKGPQELSSDEACDSLILESNQNEPPSYAGMVSRNQSGAGFGPPFPNNTSYSAKPVENSIGMIGNNLIVKTPIENQSNNNTGVSMPPPVNTFTGQASTGKQPQSNNGSKESRPGRPRGHHGGRNRNDARETTPNRGENEVYHGDNEYSGRRQPQFPDDHQVFVGNLPQDISEDTLRGFFAKFGNIQDVRINRTNQRQGSGKTPNYGFVTFDNPQVVKDILKQKIKNVSKSQF